MSILSCGGGGDGAESVLEGNIVEQSASATGFKQQSPWYSFLSPVTEAFAVISGIQVSVHGSGSSNVSDDQGFFRINGAFAGDVNVDFQTPDGTASLAVSVGSGQRVVLQNFRLNLEQQSATTEQVIVIDDTPAKNDNNNSNSNANGNSNVNGNTSAHDNDNANENQNHNDNSNTNDSANENESSSSNGNSGSAGDGN